MEPYDFKEFIIHGREERNLEYKGCVNWKDSNVKARITKTILAMGNIRDGGTIVIGVEQDGEDFIPKGLSTDQLNSFTQDGISSHVNEFADPYVEITVSKTTYDGNQFIVIQIQEFSQLPIICKRDGKGKLRKGAIYTRPRRMHETAEVPSQVEMREILDLAVDKGIRAYRSRLERTIVAPGPTDRELFDEQIKGL